MMNSSRALSIVVDGSAYNPDLGFVSQNIAALTTTKVLDPHTQHRPISLEINAAFRPQSFHIRFNFRKANWEKFTADIDSTITDMKTLYMHFDAPPGKPFCVAAEAHTYLVSTNILYQCITITSNCTKSTCLLHHRCWRRTC